ncbi:MAG: tetratricopeptide repeat protein [Xanthomonadales bacterium]|nr:tetratricopeptide repeat protein [Xanthomonadales bacterium]
MQSFISELKRRNVFKVAAAYVITGWLMVEITTTLLPTFEAPDWVIKVIIFLIMLGFPFALIFAWAFELTPEGLKRSDQVTLEESISKETGQKLNWMIITVLLVAIVVLVSTGRWSESPDEPVAAENEAYESIAVLPFANRSREEDDIYFVDGMHDDILTQLSKIQALRVISRTSVMEYRDTTKNMQQIGKELGASTILEGGVQRAGNAVRINVQLIDASNDQHLWAETYDRTLTADNVFAIQSEMASEIANALRGGGGGGEKKRLDAVPTHNLEAYEQYLLGKNNLANRRVSELQEAIAHFERAIELDPNYALAYVGLANAHSLHFNYGNVSFERMLELALPAAERAIELDPRLSDAYTALGGVYMQANDTEKARANLKKAIALNSNDALAHHWLAELTRNFFGNAEQALALHRQAATLNPRDAVIQVSICEDLFMLGRFEEAGTRALAVVESFPDYDGAYWHAGFPDWSVNGRIDKALEYFDQALLATPGDAGNHAVYAWVLGDLELDARVRKHLDEAYRLGGDFFTYLVAAMYEWIFGNEEAAVAAANGNLRFTPAATSMRVLRDRDIAAGRIGAAIERYRTLWPADVYPLGEQRYYPAHQANYWIDAAYLYALKGERNDEYEKALELTRAYIDRLPRLGYLGYELADVKLALLEGDEDEALRLFAQAVDENWLFQWRFHLSDPALDPIRDEPEFEEALARLRARIAEQRTQVSEADG